MSEVPLYSGVVVDDLGVDFAYRGISLIRNSAPPRTLQ